MNNMNNLRPQKKPSTNSNLNSSNKDTDKKSFHKMQTVTDGQSNNMGIQKINSIKRSETFNPAINIEDGEEKLENVEKVVEQPIQTIQNSQPLQTSQRDQHIPTIGNSNSNADGNGKFYETPNFKSVERQGRQNTYNMANNNYIESDRRGGSSTGSPLNKKEMHINKSDVVAYKNQIMNSAKKNESPKSNANDLTLHPVVVGSRDFNYNPNMVHTKQNINIRKGSQYTNITVVSRFRPLTPAELSNQSIVYPECTEFIDDKTVYLKTYGTDFTCKLDQIFDGTRTQEDVFKIAAKETIDQVLAGYNGTIFTYGQGNSGKTYTMFGNGELTNEETKGIIPRTIEYLFNHIENNSGTSFIVTFSMIEIYKEKLKDLLNPKTTNDDLKILDDHKNGTTIINNLHKECVDSNESTIKILEKGFKLRNVHESYINKFSSRSHVIIMMEVIQRNLDGTQKRGMLNLIDLACGEKISKTFATGESLLEAKSINLSLTGLGNVIQCLTSNKEEYIPYKDTKLTKILQESLGGTNKTTIIINCSPHVSHYEDTVGSLKFGQKAKKIKNKIKEEKKENNNDQLEDLVKTLTQQLKTEKEQNEVLRATIKRNNEQMRSNTKKTTSKFRDSQTLSKKVTFNSDSPDVSRYQNQKSVRIEEADENEDSNHYTGTADINIKDEINNEDNYEQKSIKKDQSMSVSPRKDLGKESKRGAGIGLSLGASKNSPRKDQDKSSPRKDQEKNSPRKEQEDGEEKEKYCKNSICEEFKKSQKLAIYELNITIKKLKEDITKLKVENKNKTQLANNLSQNLANNIVNNNTTSTNIPNQNNITNNDMGDMSSTGMIMNTTAVNNFNANMKKQLKELDDLVKFNIKEVNKIRKTYVDSKNSNMLQECKLLREHNKKYEEKFLKEMKKFEVFLKQTDFENSNNDYLNNPNEINLNAKFADNFIVLLKTANSITTPNKVENEIFLKSYEDLFKNTQLILSGVLEEFLEKDNIGANNLIFDHKSEKDYEEHSLTEEHFKKNKLKKIILKYLTYNLLNLSNLFSLSILNTYYEKLVGDLLNKLFIDMKKFILQDKVINDYNKRVEEFEKLMELYLAVVADLKRVKSNTDDIIPSNKKYSNKKAGISIANDLEETSVMDGGVNMKNELHLLKTYNETLKNDISKLTSDKKNIEEALEFYNETNSLNYKKELDNLKAANAIMKEFYDEEVTKKAEIIDKLSEFMNELLEKVNYFKENEKEHLENKFNNILLKYYNTKKANILTHQFRDTTKFKIVDWVDSISGTATKRMDFIKINLLDNNVNDIRIECGTGLRSQNLCHGPLIRNLKNTFVGDNNISVESTLLDADYWRK